MAILSSVVTPYRPTEELALGERGSTDIDILEPFGRHWVGGGRAIGSGLSDVDFRLKNYFSFAARAAAFIAHAWENTQRVGAFIRLTTTPTWGHMA
jgi:hypothetical protein